MQLNPNLAFNGNAPPEWADKIVYATLRSPAGAINVMDAPPGRGGEPGDNFMLGIASESRQQIDEIFSKLSAGGSVTMPLDKTFWSPRFGMLTDKFGIKWMLNLVEAV